MKIFLIILLSIGILVGTAVSIGYFLPSQHVVSKTISLQVPPQLVYDLIRDIEKGPSFRSGLQSVRVISKDPVTYVEKNKFGEMTLMITKEAPPSHLVIVTNDENLPFSGTWTFEITQTNDEGSSLSITEQGTVKNPLFRLLSRFIFGYDRSINQYLDDIRTYFSHI